MEMFRALLDILYPPICQVCGAPLVKGEDTMCLSCLMTLPRTEFHSDPFNELHKRVAAPGVAVERAAAWFHYYRDNPYARMLQRAKYNNRPEIARELGRKFANELPDDFFMGMDLLMPVPLYPRKYLKRGYNQAEEIALGIAEVTGIRIGDNLKIRSHSTQTRKNAVQRSANVADTAYVINSEELSGKHILIIDDIITTGATMLAALRALHNSAPSVRLSILTLAATHYV